MWSFPLARKLQLPGHRFHKLVLAPSVSEKWPKFASHDKHFGLSLSLKCLPFIFFQEEGDEPKVLQMAKKVFSTSLFSNIAVMFFRKVLNF